MGMNKVLNDDCAAVAQKFAGQVIGPTRLQRDMQFGYNRAARTIEGLVAKGMAVHTVATGSYACKVNELPVPAEVEYSDTETPEPTAADYRQLQLMYDKLQTELYTEKQKVLQAHSLYVRLSNNQAAAENGNFVYVANQDLMQAFDAWADGQSARLMHDYTKKMCTEFFYWWHNQTGSNTEAFFDLWWSQLRVKHV